MCVTVKTLNKDGGMSDRFDHQQWKAMQRIMSDTVRFVEQLHNIPWEEGIAPEVIAGMYHTSEIGHSVSFIHSF